MQTFQDIFCVLDVMVHNDSIDCIRVSVYHHDKIGFCFIVL